MNNFLLRRPHIDKVFCRSCNTLKDRELMHTQFRCGDCQAFARRASDARYKERMRLEPKPKPAPKPKPLQARQKRKFTPHLTMAERAEICELYFGLTMEISEIAALKNIVIQTVSKIISSYLGDGRPVTMQISFDD
jgi:hypothetical protein